MNIVCYINRIYGGGAERVMSVLVNELSARGHHVHLVTDYTAPNEYAISPNVIRSSMDGEFIKSSRTRAFFRSFQRILKLRKICIAEKADIVISFIRESNYKAIMATTFLKTKNMISVRIDPASAYHTKLQAFMAKFFYSRAEACVFQTEQALKWYPQRIQKHARVIINPIDDKFYAYEKPIERRKEIVSCGRLSTQKRFDLLIDAFAKVLPNHPEFHLTIYGDGEQRVNLEKKIAEYGIGSAVHLPGRNQDIGAAIHNSYSFVLSSDFEGLPNGLMEAMAMGLPVIATDCKGGGARAVVENESNGLLIPTGNVELMAAALERYMSEEAFAYQIGNKARETAERFKTKAVVDQWEAYTEETVGR